MKYKTINGTSYHKQTPQNIIDIMEKARENHNRLRFHWGDVNTGKDWGDTYDVAGYIGRSTGQYKIPLLIKRRDSMGGGAILDHCIVKITETTKPHNVLYQHPNYHLAD